MLNIGGYSIEKSTLRSSCILVYIIALFACSCCPSNVRWKANDEFSAWRKALPGVERFIAQSNPLWASNFSLSYPEVSNDVIAVGNYLLSCTDLSLVSKLPVKLDRFSSFDFITSTNGKYYAIIEHVEEEDFTDSRIHLFNTADWSLFDSFLASECSVSFSEDADDWEVYANSICGFYGSKLFLIGSQSDDDSQFCSLDVLKKERFVFDDWVSGETMFGAFPAFSGSTYLGAYKTCFIREKEVVQPELLNAPAYEWKHNFQAFDETGEYALTSATPTLEEWNKYRFDPTLARVCPYYVVKRVVGTDNYEFLWKFDHEFTDCRFYFDGGYLYTTALDTYSSTVLTKIDYKAGKVISRTNIDIPIYPRGPIRDKKLVVKTPMCFTRGKRGEISYHTLNVLDVETGKLSKSTERVCERLDIDPDLLSNRQVASSPDGRVLAFFTPKKASLTDVVTKRILWEIETAKDVVNIFIGWHRESKCWMLAQVAEGKLCWYKVELNKSGDYEMACIEMPDIGLEYPSYCADLKERAEDQTLATKGKKIEKGDPHFKLITHLSECWRYYAPLDREMLSFHGFCVKDFTSSFVQYEIKGKKKKYRIWNNELYEIRMKVLENGEVEEEKVKLLRPKGEYGWFGGVVGDDLFIYDRFDVDWEPEQHCTLALRKSSGELLGVYPGVLIYADADKIVYSNKEQNRWTKIDLKTGKVYRFVPQPNYKYLFSMQGDQLVFAIENLYAFALGSWKNDIPSKKEREILSIIALHRK